jgi:hypothetical protein
MNDEVKHAMSQEEKIAEEKKHTIKQINALFLKLCIWELEEGVDLTSEKEELVQLRAKVNIKIKEI